MRSSRRIVGRAADYKIRHDVKQHGKAAGVGGEIVEILGHATHLPWAAASNFVASRFAREITSFHPKLKRSSWSRVRYGPELALPNLDVGSFANLNVERPYKINRYIGPDDATTVGDLFTEVMNSIEGSWGDSNLGRLQVNPVRSASFAASPVAVFDDADIIDGSFSWLPTPSDVAPALKKVTVRYARNNAPNVDLPDGVTGDNRSRLETEWLSVVADRTVSEHTEAREITIDTLLTDEDEAQDHADFLLAFYDGNKSPAQIRVPANKVANQNIGYQNEISLDLEGLAGAKFVVTGIDFDAAAEEAEIALLIEPGELPVRSDDFNDDFNSDFS